MSVKKGDRVQLSDGRLGVVMSAGKTIKVAIDGTFINGEYSYVSTKNPKLVSLSDVPLPEEALRPKDDPTYPYTIKFVPNGGLRMGQDSEIFCLDVLKDGKKIGVQVSDDGWGGGIRVEGEDAEFEAAVKEWATWKNSDGILDPIEEWICSWIYQTDLPANAPWNQRLA